MLLQIFCLRLLPDFLAIKLHIRQRYLMVSQNNKLTNLKSFCVRVWNLRSCHLRLTLGSAPLCTVYTHREDLRSGLPVQYLNNMIYGQNLRWTWVCIWNFSQCLALIWEVSAWRCCAMHRVWQLVWFTWFDVYLPVCRFSICGLGRQWNLRICFLRINQFIGRFGICGLAHLGNLRICDCGISPRISGFGIFAE